MPPPDSELMPQAVVELQRINAELAAMLRHPPAQLVIGADRNLADPLVICGILGGKDVGKSTLVNALAAQQISGDGEEVGEGTARPLAYIHRDSIAAFKSRFAAAAVQRLDLRHHEADAIRNLVLVDLPDFDSDLPQHVETVRAVLPLLDRLIWVLTPRKIADREWVALLADVLKDCHNVHCALNKADELLSDDAYIRGWPSGFVADQSGWARDMLTRAGCTADADRLFLLAAIAPTPESLVAHVGQRWGDREWRRFAGDREAVETIGRELAEELNRLRRLVLSPLDDDQVQAVKQANQRAEFRGNVAAIRSHFQLEHWRRLLEQACDAGYHERLIAEAFDANFSRTVARRLSAGQRSETELADEALAGRVALWPILPIVFWPLRWLVRRVGARFAGGQWDARGSADRDFAVDGQPLTDRVSQLRDRLLADHALLVGQFRLVDSLPDPAKLARRVAARAGELVGELDDELLASLEQGYGRPSWAKRWLLWLILLWFPILQPLTEGLLRLLGAGGKIDILGGGLQIVTALSATHLLIGLAFVAFVYLIVLATMYARCVGQVRRVRGLARQTDDAGDNTMLTQQIEGVLIDEIVGPNAAPFAETLKSFSEQQQRLEELEKCQP